MSRYADRVARLRALLKKQQLDALIVTSLTHLQYLLGFTGTNGIGVFGRRTTAFVTDSRYRSQSARQVRDCPPVSSRSARFSKLSRNTGA